jgi:hypothetical protein
MAAGDAARRNAGSVAIPVLLLQAGSDAMVRNDGQNEACARMRDCALLQFPEALHEILMERDAIRAKRWRGSSASYVASPRERTQGAEDPRGRDREAVCLGRVDTEGSGTTPWVVREHREVAMTVNTKSPTHLLIVAAAFVAAPAVVVAVGVVPRLLADSYAGASPPAAVAAFRAHITAGAILVLALLALSFRATARPRLAAAVSSVLRASTCSAA